MNEQPAMLSGCVRVASKEPIIARVFWTPGGHPGKKINLVCHHRCGKDTTTRSEVLDVLHDKSNHRDN